MENQFKQSVSRLFPTSWSCRFGVVSDVITTQNSRNVHRIQPLSSNIRIVYPPTSKPTKPEKAKTYRIVKKETMRVSEPKDLSFSMDTEGKTCPPVTPISSQYSKNIETEKQLTIKKSSCSSNGGCFSSEEQGEIDGETDTVFSLSSDGTSEPVSSKMRSSDRRTSKGRRRRGYSEGSEMGRQEFEVSVSKNDTFNDLGNSRMKTDETQQKTTRDSRRTHETTEVSASSSDSSYHFENFQSKTTEIHQKSIKTISKTTESRRKTEKAHYCQSVPKSELQVQATLTEYYRKSRSFNRKTIRTREKTGKTRRSRGYVNQNWQLRPCAFMVDGRVEESCAMKKSSSDPHSDFKTSMVEMIVEKQIFGAEDLERLLQCFLSLNSSCHHKVIVQVFFEVCEALFTH